MIGRETAAFLETGCTLIVGTVGPEGEPHAARGWGLTVLDDERALMRLLLDADDPEHHAHLAPGGAIAITGGDVRTLRSIQIKGRSLGVEPPNDSDPARAARFIDEMITAIHESDGTDPIVSRRMAPTQFVACMVEIDEIYDQTPGPGAGAAISRGTP